MKVVQNTISGERGNERLYFHDRSLISISNGTRFDIVGEIFIFETKVLKSLKKKSVEMNFLIQRS